MTNLWLKIRIWTKVAVVALLAIYIIIFFIANSSTPVTVWVWGKYTFNVLPLIFFTFLAGVVATVLVRTTFRTVRQIRELRARNRSDRLHQEVEDMKAKTEKLQTRPQNSAEV